MKKIIIILISILIVVSFRPFLSDGWNIAITAFLPTGLHFAIPFGMLDSKLTLFEITTISISANIFATFTLIFLIKTLKNSINTSSLHENKVNGFLKKILVYIRSKMNNKFVLLLSVFIATLVGGNITGVLVSESYSLNWRQYTPVIALGIIIAGIITMQITIGAILLF